MFLSAPDERGDDFRCLFLTTFIICRSLKDLDLEPLEPQCIGNKFCVHVHSRKFFPSGDVVLKNLVLKQSALSELDLPVQTVYGHLGSLVLKIPWKNLYSAPVEAYIDRLYLLAVPNSSVRYNAEREDKATLEAKKAELERIQLAKKMELEKSKKNIHFVCSGIQRHFP
jgi:hypothetical protein